MIADTEIFGVLLNVELITSVLALVLTFALHRMLVFFGLHRRIWHPALFETSLFVILWGAITYVSLTFT
jgi:hypothetical protein